MTADDLDAHEVCDPCLSYFGACAPWEWAKSLHDVSRDAGASLLSSSSAHIAQPDDLEAAMQVRLAAKMLLAQLAEALNSMPFVSGGGDGERGGVVALVTLANDLHDLERRRPSKWMVASKTKAHFELAGKEMEKAEAVALVELFRLGTSNPNRSNTAAYLAVSDKIGVPWKTIQRWHITIDPSRKCDAETPPLIKAQREFITNRLTLMRAVQVALD
jgi:hypothetical protein